MTSSAIDSGVSRTETELARHGDDVWISSFLSSFIGALCRVRNEIMYLLSWLTLSALTRVLFLCVYPELRSNEGNKHKRNPVVSAETVRHPSAYIIPYIYIIYIYIYIYIYTNYVGIISIDSQRNGNHLPHLKIQCVWFSGISKLCRHLDFVSY